MNASGAQGDTGISFANHLRVLDGWRGLSILLVLTTHLVPVGPHANASIGILGMVLFFTLSGFLITSSLLKSKMRTSEFLLRRFFRIVPLAWLYCAIVFAFQSESLHSMMAHFLFYANLPPPQVRLATDHLWSLCLEAQFYVGVALLFKLFKQSGLLILPVLGLAFTTLRIVDDVTVSSITWFRIDEVLAGTTLALVHHGRLGVVGSVIRRALPTLPQWPLFALLALSSLFDLDHARWIAYPRPYLSALLVGATLANPSTSLGALLGRRTLQYIATISYALYVIHLGLAHTWLGSGDLLEKYAKRPLLLAVLFVTAHVSTFHYEHPLISYGRRLAKRWAVARPQGSLT